MTMTGENSETSFFTDPYRPLVELGQMATNRLPRMNLYS